MAERTRSALDVYRAKRSPGKTHEPFGGEGVERPGLFVVQQHAARNLHWDLRLEMGGSLRSWAVPKGPSLDPQEKRLAVATEDHPLEYGDFEGVIPAGNYGAGAMIVWDRGRWICDGDPEAGVEAGKLLFELKGYKLGGVWTLVKTKQGPKDWLLIKKPDAWATGEDAVDLPGESVLSGLTVEELAEGSGREEEVLAGLAERQAPRRTVRPEAVKLMLAETAERPFTKPGWLFELKYDGYRALAAKADGAATLLYRSGREATATYPELARAVAALPYGTLVLDGEIAVLDDEARPSFQRLQQRGMLSRSRDVERAAIELPATYFAFDLLAFGPYDVRPLPLLERKALLRRLLPHAGPLRFADHVEERGEALFAEVEKRGLEGLVAKRADGPYRGGRSRAWLKLRCEREASFVVVGFTEPQGTRVGFGALHLGVLDGAHLVYAGRAGTGFTDRQLAELRERLDALTRDTAPCTGDLPEGAEHRWVEPRLVARVRYLDWTDAGQLRQPVFLALEEGKRVEDCVRPGGASSPAPAEPPADPPKRPPKVHFSNLDKVFWPTEGYTKGDLIDYYRTIAPCLLPYLEDRPLVLDRYPDGIDGKSFFQKNAPDFAPAWFRTEAIWSEDTGRDTLYFICEDEESLLYLVNLAAIPLHLWSSRLATLHAPDWSILDLDAKDAPFENVIAVARATHALCEEIGLPSYVKTSGASGMHVLFPTGGKLTHEQSRQLAEVIARVIAAELPEIASVYRSPARREGKVYLDHLQNGYGKLLVAPYSARPVPGAKVSMPLEWKEVKKGLDPLAFTIKTAAARVKKWRGDPVRGVLEGGVELMAVLEGLGGRVG